MSSGFRIDASKVITGLADTAAKVDINTKSLGRELASEFQKEARQGAAWTDHTHYARDTLKGESKSSGGRTVVSMSGDAEYQEYLEFGHGERFAIIYPMWEDMRTRLAKMYGQTALGSGGSVGIKRNAKRKR